MYWIIDILITLLFFSLFVYGCTEDGDDYLVAVGIIGYLIYPLLVDLGYSLFCKITFNSEKYKS